MMCNKAQGLLLVKYDAKVAFVQYFRELHEDARNIGPRAVLLRNRDYHANAYHILAQGLERCDNAMCFYFRDFNARCEY